MTRDEATAYVRELFEFVAGMSSPSEADVAAWTERALAIGNPTKVLTEFATVPSLVDHRRVAKDCETRWPHGHFYSPVVSRAEVAKDHDRIFGPRELRGIDLRPDAQQALFGRLAQHLTSLPFPETKTAPYRYYYDNDSYAFGDASIYWAMLHELRPKRIVEVGSGFSSALALDTIATRGLGAKCTFVEPFPDRAMGILAPLGPRDELLAIPVQQLDLRVVESLEPNDVLFIDSTHVVKTGSDVHFELTEILPRVPPGVVVHFHDMFYPFEYPEDWVVAGNHSWNELYAVHAFLLYNTAFQVEFFNTYFARVHRATVERLAPSVAARFLLNPGGGLWLRRC